MCATDRSQIAVSSQTELFNSLCHLINMSSCPILIRDSCGELIHTNPLFDKIFLTNTVRESWLSSIPIETGIDLVRAELNTLTSRIACLVRHVQLNDQSWTVFIECVPYMGGVFSKWVFINEGCSIDERFRQYRDFSMKVDRYFECVSMVANSDWNVMNLYAVGFSHSMISRITGLEEQTSKNVVSKMKRKLKYPDRDYLIMSSICTFSYAKIVSNVLSILRLKS